MHILASITSMINTMMQKSASIGSHYICIN